MPELDRDGFVIGAANLYTAPAGEALPATLDDDPAGNWESVGYTDEATRLQEDKTLAAKSVQQSQSTVKRKVVGREVTVTATLSEVTLENLKLAAAGAGTITETAAGAGTPGHKALSVSASEDTDEIALLFDTVGPGGYPRRVWIPACVVTSSTSVEHDRSEYAMVEVTFAANDNGVDPLYFIDDKTADAV